MTFEARSTTKDHSLPGLPPRLLSAGWAVYAIMAATAYITMNPVAQRGNVTQLPEPLLATAWSTIAIILTLGAVLPARYPLTKQIGRQCRIVGVTMLAAMFAAWASTYVIDGVTGHSPSWLWVVGRNYLFLLLAAIVSASHIAKNHAPGKEPPT